MAGCKASQTTICEDPKSPDCPVAPLNTPSPAQDQPAPTIVTPISSGSVVGTPDTSFYNGSPTSLVWDASIHFQLERDDVIGIYRDTQGTILIEPQPMTAGEISFELTDIQDFNGPTTLYAKSNKDPAPYVPLGMIGAEPVSFALPGTDGAILAMAKDTVSAARGCTVSTPCVYVAGNFDTIAGIKAKNIAMYRYSTGQYEPLDKGVDQNSVMALAVSSTGDLYVGGDFYAVNGNMANTSRLARWDGSAWSSVGGGVVNDPVFALLLHAGELYVGGLFTLPGNQIARYTIATSTWSQLTGNVVFNQAIKDIAWDPINNTIVVGGNFTTPELYVARYQDTDLGDPWKTAVTSSSAVNNQVTALAFDVAGRLYIGGDFTLPFPALFKVPANSTVAESIGTVQAMTVTRDLSLESSNQLYAVGTFGVLKLIYNSGVPSLSSVGDRPQGDLRTMMWLDAQKLLVGGIFETNSTHSKKMKNLALWDGVGWSAMGFSKSVDDWIKAINVDTSSGPSCSADLPCLDIGGWFGFAGDVLASKIARYETASGKFSAFNGGPPGGSEVNTILRDGSQMLFAGGSFSSPTPGFSQWFNGAWKTTNDWLITSPISVLTWGLDGDILGGGMLETAGGQAVSRLFGWSRSSSPNVWKSFGAGFNDTVTSIAVDHKRRKIYVGGQFSTPQSFVAMYDDSLGQWSSLGSGLNGTVMSLALDSSGSLYAGGHFTMSGATTVNRLAKWNGQAWSRVGSHATNIGMDGWVGALAIDSKDNLYAGGEFFSVDGVAAHKVAKWDGTHWSSLGPEFTVSGSPRRGVDAAVVGIACDPKDHVYFTGYFKNAGGKFRPQIVKYIPELNSFY